MNDPKRIEEMERHINKLETETNENLTMLLGQAWKQTEILRWRRDERGMDGTLSPRLIYLPIGTPVVLFSMWTEQNRMVRGYLP